MYYENTIFKMTEQQKEFLRLHVICDVDYNTISQKINVPKSTLSKWYEDLRSERERIARIKTVWTKKKFTPVFEDFYNKYLAMERKCEYCSVTEDEIRILLDRKRIYTKRIPTRGRTLEFDRKMSELQYAEFDNVVLCCYWCNNAKTDEFSYEEFKEVGKVFEKIWKKRLEE
jgi:hypothetical protein